MIKIAKGQRSTTETAQSTLKPLKQLVKVSTRTHSCDYRVRGSELPLHVHVHTCIGKSYMYTYMYKVHVWEGNTCTTVPYSEVYVHACLPQLRSTSITTCTIAANHVSDLLSTLYTCTCIRCPSTSSCPAPRYKSIGLALRIFKVGLALYIHQQMSQLQCPRVHYFYSASVW